MREFLVFSKTLNYSLAAKELYISNTTLSAHVSALENEIGAPLVRKRSAQLSLTPAGTALILYGRDLLKKVDECIEGCKDADRLTIAISIASNNLSGFEVKLWKQARAFEKSDAGGRNIDITALPVFTQGVEALLRSGADIAPLALPSVEALLIHPKLTAEHSCFHFLSEELLLHIPEGHALAKKNSIKAKDLDGLSILYANDDAWVEGGEYLRNAFMSQGSNVFLRIVHANSFLEYCLLDAPNCIKVVGSGAVDRYASEKQMEGRFVRLDDLPIKWETFLVYRNELEEDSDKFAFISSLM